MNDEFPLGIEEDEFGFEGMPSLDLDEVNPKLALRSEMPMFQTLFIEAVAGDKVLEDFARDVVGELSDRFALKAAKGGAFFQEREAEGMKNTQRFQRDQSLRAHLINGMLPALHIARYLAQWGGRTLETWNGAKERLFIAGYMLHDFSKIEDVKKTLRDEGFRDGESPSERQMPVLEKIFREWTVNLGIEAFLSPVGGAESYLHELIYIACNTQRLKGTARAPFLYTKRVLDVDSRHTITELSRLADLLAYVAPSPRDLVAHEGIRSLIVEELAYSNQLRKPVGRLVYHHVAENRGLLLNFIHNAVIDTLRNEARIPLLFAPSGVVYLERHDAPAIPEIDDLVGKVVETIRQTAGKRTVETGVGSQLNKDGLRVQETFRDLFDLREIVEDSHRLVWQIRGNAPQYMEFLENSGWPHANDLPVYSKDKTDARLRQMAEWASLVETQFEERLPNDVNHYIDFVFEAWNITDLRSQFEELRPYQQKGTGIRHRWYWAAAHALDRSERKQPHEVLAWLQEQSTNLAALLPQELPAESLANQGTWDDLSDYIKTVLTLGGVKSLNVAPKNELANYSQAKGKRGKPLCAICGSDYSIRGQVASSVAFQPWVYTARVKINPNNNQRNICSICALEQLLRQLFVQVEDLSTGKDAEAQRIRYLSFYPSYFFSPETLQMVQRAYSAIKSIRLSDADLWRALRGQSDLGDVKFWQRLDAFLLRPEGEVDDAKFKKVLRYSGNAQSTFFTVGFRNLDPTETESWVLPAFLAFVMSICLDVKVVASDSGVPLMLESAELPETLWFDGAHASVQALIQHGRLHIDNVGKALARLTAAYLIHLDTEYAPPKENWQRFAPIANALCESPLYAFHYLKKQERDDRPLSQDKVRRYIGFAELFTEEGDKDMSHAKELVRLYRGFYRAKSTKNANSILRPLSVVSDALLIADPRLFNDTESLVEVAHGELYRFMDRVGKGLADGRFPKGITVEERQSAMREFSRFFVTTIFEGAFGKDVAALRGKQLNLLKSACEVLYRDAQYQEWAERGRDTEETEDESEEN